MEFIKESYGFRPDDNSQMLFRTTEAPRELTAVRVTSHAPNSSASRLEVAGLTAVRSVSIDDLGDRFSWTTNAVYTVYRYVRPEGGRSPASAAAAAGSATAARAERNATLVIGVSSGLGPRFFHFDYITVERELLTLLATCDAVTCFSLCTLYVQAIDAADSQGRHDGVQSTLQAHLEGRLKKSTRRGRTTVRIVPRPLRTFAVGDGMLAKIDVASGRRPGDCAIAPELQPHPFADDIERATGIRPSSVVDTRFDATPTPAIAALGDAIAAELGRDAPEVSA